MLGFTKLMQTSQVLVHTRLVAFQSANYSKKSVEEKLGLPLKPKRPLTPYFRFMAEVRPKTVTEYPKLSLTEIAQVLGKKWKEADEQTKSKFAAAFLKEKEAYDKLKARYESSLTQEQKDEIVDYRKTIAEKKEKLAHKKKNRDNNKPKRPVSAFLRFSNEVKAKESRGDVSIGDYSKIIAQRWAKLSEEKKKQYYDASKKETEAHKLELAKWEKKMMSLGNEDLVRRSEVNPREPRSKQVKSD